MYSQLKQVFVKTSHAVELNTFTRTRTRTRGFFSLSNHCNSLFFYCVYLGYPGAYEKDKEIEGVAAAEGTHEGVHVFHAGTRLARK